MWLIMFVPSCHWHLYETDINEKRKITHIPQIQYTDNMLMLAQKHSNTKALWSIF